MKQYYRNYIDNNHSFNKKTMIGIMCLLISITGVFGFFYEFIFYFFNGGMKAFYWRGGNFLPWINIYAIGGIGIYLLTYKHRSHPLKVFLISLFLSGILEYVAGLGIYIIGNGTRWWDYNTEILNFGNIGGFVCLRSVLFFGLSGLVLIYFFVPLIFNLVKKVSKEKFFIISVIICSIFLFDEIYNLVFTKLFSLPSAYEIYNNIGFSYYHFK